MPNYCLIDVQQYLKSLRTVRRITICLILCTFILYVYLFQFLNLSLNSKPWRSLFNLGPEVTSDSNQIALSKPSFRFVPFRCAQHTNKHEERITEIQSINIWDELRMNSNFLKTFPNYSYNADVVQTMETLKVFVVPHSHVDPGWLRTFEDYGVDVIRILDNAVSFLKSHRSMTFQWTETAFFHFWWTRQNETTKLLTKNLIRNKQLEFTGGAWVMTDEANPYFWATIDNIIEGHQYLLNELQIIPKVSWSNDPFGYGPTVPYLFKKAGVNWQTINRFHHVLKNKFAIDRNLVFNWHQIWSTADSADVLTHGLPFRSYDVPQTCGPDWSVCCQFDFKRITHFTCDNYPTPQAITLSNVADGAAALYDQYRKLSKLYRHNVLLVPLGDDFRYDMIEEFHQQYDNYMLLFNYMNAHKEWNIEVRFGIMSDYFETLLERSTVFPEFSGDLFPYSDVPNQYWTGYFTSRPLYKRMDRIVQAQIRAADVFWSVAAQKMDSNKQLAKKIETFLTSSHRQLLLFQHHDAITGTSRAIVMADYGRKLLDAYRKASQVLAASINLIEHPQGNGVTVVDTAEIASLDKHLTVESSFQDTNCYRLESNFIVNEIPLQYNALPTSYVINLQPGQSRTLVVANSLPKFRKEIIRIRVNAKDVKIREMRTRHVLTIQINPIVQDLTGDIINDQFEVIFYAALKSLSLTAFSIISTDQSEVSSKSNAFAHLYKRSQDSISANNVFKIKDLTDKSTMKNATNHAFNMVEVDSENAIFFIKGSKFLTAHSLETGLLQNIVQGVHNIKAQIEFWEYKHTGSGAYLFLPLQPPKLLTSMVAKVFVIAGRLLSEIHTIYADTRLHHVLSVYKTHGVLNEEQMSLRNVVNITNVPNTELVMRIHSDINNGNTFFTDINGFQILKRRYFINANIEENYYPMPTSIFVQDAKHRLTLLSGQPHGATSHISGGIEIMLDRIAMTDDSKGLSEIMKDNVPAASYFSLLVEHFVQPSPHEDDRLASHSTLGNLALESLLNPPVIFHYKSNAYTATSQFAPLLNASFPCDVQLVSLRHLATRDADAMSEKLMVLHQKETSCNVEIAQWLRNECGDRTDEAYWHFLELQKAKVLREVTLAATRDIGTLDNAMNAFSLDPMDIRSFQFSV